MVLLIVDPIDCDSDPCHLTWLLRENRHYLNLIHNGKCLNGLSFGDVNSEPMLENCPVNILFF